MSSSSVAVIAGYGTGISHAVANYLGKKGYTLALVSRTQSKLDEAAAHLKSSNIKAQGFAVDLSQPTEVTAVLSKIQSSLGSVGILFWNPYGAAAGVLDATPEQLVSGYNLTTTSLITAVQKLHSDLKANKGAVLVTGGGLSLENPESTKLAVNWNAATLAIAKAAQRKTVDILHVSLEPSNVYVGEVTVLGIVKGTPFDADGKSTLTAESIAEAFGKLLAERSETFTSIS